MSDAFADLDSGFYWIRFSDNELDVARWDAETREWYRLEGRVSFSTQMTQGSAAAASAGWSALPARSRRMRSQCNTEGFEERRT